MVEAAGIEPASESGSTSASTCVVCYLGLTKRNPNRRGFHNASRIKSRLGSLRQKPRGQPLKVGAPVQALKARPDGTWQVIKLPVRTSYRSQLRFFPMDLRGNGSSTRCSRLSTPVEARSPPANRLCQSALHVEDILSLFARQQRFFLASFMRPGREPWGREEGKETWAVSYCAVDAAFAGRPSPAGTPYQRGVSTPKRHGRPGFRWQARIAYWTLIIALVLLQ